MFVSACSRHQQIVLTSDDGAHQLIYEADVFSPQARTPDDIYVLNSAASQIMWKDGEDVVTCTALRSALKLHDWKELERLIYNYKVAQLKKQQ